jgi:hypothetical protein
LITNESYSTVILVTAAYQLSGCKKVDQKAVKKQMEEMKDKVNLLNELNPVEISQSQSPWWASTPTFDLAIPI